MSVKYSQVYDCASCFAVFRNKHGGKIRRSISSDTCFEYSHGSSCARSRRRFHTSACYSLACHVPSFRDYNRSLRSLFPGPLDNWIPYTCLISCLFAPNATTYDIGQHVSMYALIYVHQLQIWFKRLNQVWLWFSVAGHASTEQPGQNDKIGTCFCIINTILQCIEESFISFVRKHPLTNTVKP